MIQFLKDNPVMMDDITRAVFDANGMKYPGGPIKAPAASTAVNSVKAEASVSEEKADLAKPLKVKAGHA